MNKVVVPVLLICGVFIFAAGCVASSSEEIEGSWYGFEADTEVTYMENTYIYADHTGKVQHDKVYIRPFPKEFVWNKTGNGVYEFVFSDGTKTNAYLRNGILELTDDGYHWKLDRTHRNLVIEGESPDPQATFPKIGLVHAAGD